MSKLNLTALLLGAALFTGLGAVSLSASSKCGADHMEKSGGKCGGASEKSEKKMKCGAGKCGGAEKSAKKCGGADKSAKKCGGEKKAPAKMKCGAGKCGGK